MTEDVLTEPGRVNDDVVRKSTLFEVDNLQVCVCVCNNRDVQHITSTYISIPTDTYTCTTYHSSISEALADIAELIVREQLVLALHYLS